MRSYAEITSPEIERLWKEHDEHWDLFMNARKAKDRRASEHARRCREIKARIEQLKDDILERER